LIGASRATVPRPYGLLYACFAMASLDSLPADQRAVLELVLRRGRSYEEIADLLSISRAGVRERALAALDAIGPRTGVSEESRALITDYLLGALADEVAEVVHDHLASSPSERAWARVVASELAEIANRPLPEIPAAADARPRSGGVDASPRDRDGRTRGEESVPQAEFVVEPEARAPEPEAPALEPEARAPEPEVPAAEELAQPAEPEPQARAAEEPPAPAQPEPEPEAPAEPEPVLAATPGAPPGATDEPPATRGSAGRRPVSRRGGAILLAGAALVAIAVVLVLVLPGGGTKHPRSASSTTTTPGSSTTGTSTTGAQIVAQINLRPPGGGSSPIGIAEVLREQGATGVAIVAQGLAPNSKNPPNAYAVWLYNSPGDSLILGFVNPAVGSNGRLQTEGALPANARHYQKLLVTLETQSKPKTPGKIVLEGPLTGV